MPTEKLSMRKIREILRLRYEHRCNYRDIGRSVGVSPSTVSSYLRQAKIAGLTWPLSNDLDEEQLYACLFPPAPDSSKNKRPLPDLVKINQELKRKGVTLLLLWYDYRNQHPTGYGYS